QPQAAKVDFSVAADLELNQQLKDIRQKLKARDMDGTRAALKELEGRCKDRGITSYEVVSAALTIQAKSYLDADDITSALLLLDTAIYISPNYPPPYFERGWAYLAQDKLKGLKALDSFVEGFRYAFKDFWWSFFYAGNKLASLLFTVAALFAFFGLFMALRYTPLLAHDISELIKKPGLEDKLKYVTVPAIFMVVLILFGYWWAATAVFLSLWLYFNRMEKTLAVVFFLLLVFMPEIMGNLACFSQASGNRLLWVMDKVSKGQIEEGTEQYLKDVLSKEPDNQPASMTLAQFYKKQGRYPEAAAVYDGLITKDPSNAAYRNNLGNVHFLMRDFEGAIREYKGVIQYNPSDVIACFNMSQAYGEALMFSERESADLAARQIDPSLLGSLRERAGSTPARMIYDEQVPARAFWTSALSDRSQNAQLANSLWESSVSVLPLQGVRVAGISFIILAFSINAFRKNSIYSHFCQKCGKVSCRKCQKPHYDKVLCAQCHQIFVKLDGVEAKDRVSKMLETRTTRQQKGVVYRVVSLLLPGGGHFLAGSPLLGFIFMGSCIFLVKDIFFGDFFSIPNEFNLHVWRPDTMALSVLLVIVYGITQLDTHRITK
ncbi:MAG TPA: tetratricopeptide repeat protein, partial [Nitrospirota bacterium]